MPFDSGTAQLDAPAFDPATAHPDDATGDPGANVPRGTMGQAPDWKSLYSGLETPAKGIADSAPSHTVTDPEETAARNINQVFVKEQLGGHNGPVITSSNWDAIKAGYASVRFGTSSSKVPSDKELYGMISKQIEPLTEPKSLWTILNTPFVELPEAPALHLPKDDPRTQWAAIYNGVRPLLMGLETPIGVMGMGVGGALGPMAKTVPAARFALAGMSGVFTAMMAGGTVESVEARNKIAADPNSKYQQKLTANINVAASGLATLAGAIGTVHAVMPDIVAKFKGQPIEQAPDIIKDGVAKAQDLSPEQEQAALHAAQQIEAVTKASHPDAPPHPDATPTSPVQAGDKPQYGIAERVSDVRGKAGVIDAPEPGEGIAPATSVERGRTLLAGGADPDAILSEFNKTNRFSSDDLAVLRAKGEDLAQAASEAAEKFGPESPEYKAAAKADSDWTKAIKPVQTEWAKAGAAQQGSTDIDTGDFHSLATAFKEISGRDFTPEETAKAQEIADGVTDASHDAETAKAQVIEEIKKQVPEKAPPRTKHEPGSVGDVWQRAKDMVEAGEDDFDDLRHKIAADTGLPVEDVTKKLAGPKRVRVMTNEMYSKMAQSRELIAQANHWLKQQAMPGWQRFVSQIPRAFFGAKVFGHGTVGMITHAGINMFDPTEWGTYWPEFVKQYKLIGWHDQGAFHERAMQDLARDKNYTTARRAGLANNAVKAMDDYQKGFLGKIGLAGNRGFDALKIYRQARFNQTWDALTPEMRTPEMAKLLADDVNHSTGYVRANFPKAVSTAFFAPKLEGSRWAFLIGDPIRDAKTFAGWKDATMEERYTALSNVKRRAIIAGTYLTLLAANQGLLEVTESKEKVNFSNPRKPDFLAFKGFGHELGVISPTIGLFRYLSNMLHASIEKRTGSELKDSRAEEMGALTTKYLRAKLSPFGQFVADVGSQADYQGRPMPFSSDKVPSYLKKEGSGPYTYAEYASKQLAPIPIEDAIKEVWSNQGMSEKRISDWTAALATMALVGGTGARVSKDTDLQDQQKKAGPAMPPRDITTSHRNTTP